MTKCLNCAGTNLSYEGLDPEGRGRVWVCIDCGECFDETDAKVARQDAP